MKKYIIIFLACISILAIQNDVKANEDVGLGKIIFEEDTSNTSNTTMINEISYRAVSFHLLLAGKHIEEITYEGEALQIIKKLEELTKADILDILSMADNKEETLKTYLTECETALQKGDIVSSYMLQEMTILKSDMQACVSDKNVADKSYFDAITRYDQSMMEDALNNSLIYETCISENRIQYNAKLGITRKIVFYLGILQKKYDLLIDKQEVLTKNFNIMEDKILEELTQLYQLLKQYKF